MKGGELQQTCPECGLPLGTTTAERRCAPCFDAYLRRLDADFLDNYARLGARSHIIVAEACLKGLVLSDVADRKLLAMTIYERFIAAAGDLIGLYHALRRRREQPIMASVLGFTLDEETARAFFDRLLAEGPIEMLHAVGLPHPDQLPAESALLDRREMREVRQALLALLADFTRLTDYAEIGRRALGAASRRLLGPVGLTEQTEWLTERRLGPAQVAALTLDREERRLDVNVLSIEEETLGNVVDGIETLTRLTRNLVFAFVSLHHPDDFARGFSGDESSS